jgi:cleavage and polyadenylation specificity factor subunit 2
MTIGTLARLPSDSRKYSVGLIYILSYSSSHLEFFSSPAALTATYPSSKPKLILAVPTSLSHGSSRALFADFASVRDNVVLLTSRSEEGTLCRLLLDKWDQRQKDDERWDKGNIGSVIELDESIHIKVSIFW